MVRFMLNFIYKMLLVLERILINARLNTLNNLNTFVISYVKPSKHFLNVNLF